MLLASRSPPPGIEIIIDYTDPKNAYDAMLLLGIAAYGDAQEGSGYHPAGRGPYLLLEPWAVQMALNRRGLKSLTDTEKEMVNTRTRNAGSLHWPPRFRHAR